MSLQARCDSFDVQQWRRQQSEHPGRAIPQKDVSFDTSQLHNPYAGVAYAWQLTEKIEDFLERLPPRTTLQTEKTPWIFICNPYIPRVEKSQASNQASRGNEDEAPEEFGSRTNVVVEGGMERLELVRNFAEGMRRTGKPQTFQERELQQERKRAADDILNLAHACKVRAGKVWKHFEFNRNGKLTVLVDALLPACRS